MTQAWERDRERERERERNKRGNIGITQHCGVFVQPLLHWKSNKYYVFWVWVCSLRYTVCNADAPYCRLWSAWLYNIFLTLSHKWDDFRKKFIGHKMCILFFWTTFVWNISHSKNNWERYNQKFLLVSL